jgi:hypothetical protein
MPGIRNWRHGRRLARETCSGRSVTRRALAPHTNADGTLAAYQYAVDSGHPEMTPVATKRIMLIKVGAHPRL